MEYKLRYGYIDDDGFMCFAYTGYTVSESGLVSGLSWEEAAKLATKLTDDGYYDVSVCDLNHSMYD